MARLARAVAFAIAAFGAPARADVAEQLARLVEIDAAAVSPDGRYVAYRTRHPDPAANRYTLRWQLVGIDGGAPADLGDGGEVELRVAEDGHVVGTIAAPAPVWSPDARHVLLTKRRAGVRELWIAGPKVPPRRLAGGDRDIAPDARWMSPTRVALRQAPPAAPDARERWQGTAVGPTYRPGWALAPPSAARVYATAIVGLDGRPATGVADPPPPPEPGARHATDGAAPAWGRLADPALTGPMAPLTVVAATAGAGVAACPDPRCTGPLAGLWRLGDGRVAFVRLEGPNQQRDALYLWRPGAATARPVELPDEAALERCSPAHQTLVCVLETPTRSGRLVRLGDGAVTVLADPNPAFRVTARVERLEWAGPWGRQFGHLVLPADAKAGAPLPLVVVQYRSRGFLKGGVGDEYPVFALADAGLAVLSFDRPNALDRLTAIGDPAELTRRILGGEPDDRRALYAGLEAGLALARRRAPIDAARLGISGLSDGAVMTAHALLASRRFAAAAISSPVWDPIGYFTVHARARTGYRGAGLGDPFASPERWRQLSPALNVERIETPLLLQLADHELMASAQLLAALEAAKKPHDAYVFAGEYHIKWQPAHRLAIYRRAVDWFAFWLQGREPADPARQDEYARWRALRR